MKKDRVVVEFDRAHDGIIAGTLKVEMPELGHFNFESVPEAFNRLIVMGCAGRDILFRNPSDSTNFFILLEV